MVKPLEELANDQNPAKYRPYSWGKFLATRKRTPSALKVRYDYYVFHAFAHRNFGRNNRNYNDYHNLILFIDHFRGDRSGLVFRNSRMLKTKAFSFLLSKKQNFTSTA
ncbi:hypothetical protein LguiA_008890 [Lonicera macranthoides]